jgi:hypothetical protein
MVGVMVNRFFGKLWVGDAAWKIGAAGYLMLVLVSANLLVAVGDVGYVSQGGSPLAKFHPGSYLILLAGAMRLVTLSRGGVPDSFYPPQFGGIAFYLGAIATTFGVNALAHGLFDNVSFYIDSLLIPAVLYVLLITERKETLCALAKVTILIELANACVAIGEGLVQQHLIPFYTWDPQFSDRPDFLADDVDGFDGFRATAFHGHPLDNAQIASTALLALYDGFASGIMRAVFRGALLVALLAFGGRTGLVVTLAALLPMYALRTVHAIGSRRLRYDHLSAALMLLLVLPLVAGVLVSNTSLGARIWQNLYWDDSAAVRSSSLDVFHLMSWPDLVFGVSNTAIRSFAAQLAIPGFENFWILMILKSGIAGFIPFLCAFAWIVGRMWRLGDAQARIATVAFVVICSSNNSLASKSSALSTLVVIALCATAYLSPSRTVHRFARRDVRPPARHASLAASGGAGRRPGWRSA